MPEPAPVTEPEDVLSAGLAPHHHGGDPKAAARALYGLVRTHWLDLSTGINRRPYPVAPLADDCWHGLPTAGQRAALMAAATDYYQLPDARFCLPVPGSQAAIGLLPCVIAPMLQKRPVRPSCAVLSPTYSEHAAAWAAQGFAVSEPTELAQMRADIAVVVNPNNPDGRLHDPDTLLALADAQASRGGLLVVDEAFCDLAPEASLAPHAGRPGLVVLRSAGKFFGLAGLRLGFVLADQSLLARLQAFSGPWAVSAPALVVGQRALSDWNWAAQTRQALQAGQVRLDALLAQAGLEVIGGTTLFRLIQTADAAKLHEALARQGVWTRHFAARPDWLRFAVPGSNKEFAWLKTALERCAAGRAKAGAVAP